MHGALICLLFAAAGQAAEPQDPRPFHEIHQDLRDLIRREARATTDQDRAETIVAMTELYQELRKDPRLATSYTLKQYRAKLWSKLTQIQESLRREFDLPRTSPAGDPRARGRLSREAARQQELAELSETITWSMAQQMDLGSYGLGGPSRLIGAAGGSLVGGAAGGQGVADYGPALVELIQRTIDPNFWDVNGGPGTIVYFAPLHALVVRASAEVHGQLGGVLGGLRAAGP